jgi:hypothetical protein
MQPAIQLGRHPDLLTEQLRQAATAETGIAGHVQDAPDVRSIPEFTQRILDRRMQLEPLPRSVKQRRFQHAKPLKRGAEERSDRSITSWNLPFGSTRSLRWAA